MFNSKNTKRALVSSTIALIVCISMLIGSTYAWFTDSVSSSNNIIKSGNLDVEFKYSTDLTNWNNVTETTNIFKTDTLWEPGHTEVVYLSIENVGSLDLKYQLGINIVSETGSINKDGNPFKLSQFIDFGVKDPAPATKYATAADAILAVKDSAKKISAGFTKANELQADSNAEIVALVVYMPTTVTNEANYKTGEAIPQIKLGLNLVASQLASESDSFGSNYDALATFPNGFYTAPQENFSESSNETTFSFENDTETVKISGTTEADKDVTASITPTTPHDDTNAFSLKSEGVDVVSYDIKVENYTNDVTVEIFIGKGLVGVELYHDGVAMDAADYSYDSATGYVTFKTTSFSIFDIALVNPADIKGGEALKAVLDEKDEIKLTQDITLSGTYTIPEGRNIVLDLNGKTISGTTVTPSGSIVSLFDVRGTLVVKNGTITVKHTDTNMEWNKASEIFYVGFNGRLDVIDATLENLGGTDMAYCVDMVNATNITFNATNSTIKSTYIPVRVFNNGSGMNNVSIKDCDVIGTSRALWVHIFTPVDNTSGKYKGIYKEDTLNLDIYNNGNTFTASNPDRIIEYGFTDPINFNATGDTVLARNAAAIQYAADKGLNVTLCNDIDLSGGLVF